MAIFSIAIALTELREGRYVNNPHDSGGETYKGISRNNWPTWAGWHLVDAHKPSGNFPHCLDLDSVLQGLVIAFYRANFWIYDEIVDQPIANKLFDLAVNVGKVHSTKIAQQAVGVDPDGFLGPQTIHEINATQSGSLLAKIKLMAEAYHKEIVHEHPQDAIFLKGWLSRDAA